MADNQIVQAPPDDSDQEEVVGGVDAGFDDAAGVDDSQTPVKAEHGNIEWEQIGEGEIDDLTLIKVEYEDEDQDQEQEFQEGPRVDANVFYADTQTQ